MKTIGSVYEKNIIPLKAPVDSAGTAYATAYVDLKNALHCTFFAYFGVVTAASADQGVVVTIEASTSTTSNATEVAIAYSYRKSGVAGANTWTAPTAIASTGYTVGTTEDGIILAIEIDPAKIEAAHGQRDAKYVRLVCGIDAGGTVTLNAVWAVLDPMYPQTTHLSAT